MTVHGLERDQLVSRMSAPREERESKEEQILELLGAGESFTENNKREIQEREGPRERERRLQGLNCTAIPSMVIILVGKPGC